MSAPSSGLLRVPFVRRCTLRFPDGSLHSFFLVNINVLGAYVARDDLTPGHGSSAVMPNAGERVLLQCALPGREGGIEMDCLVGWQNTHQQHPVHGLPPGFGLRFVDLSAETRRLIEHLVRDYVTRRTR